MLQLKDNNKEFFEQCFKNNESVYSKYNKFTPLIFTELSFNINEIARCLIVEAYSAAITLTNHMLERLLKLALIEDEMQLLPLNHPYQACWDRMYPYFDLDMQITINRCATKQLISGKVKKQLLVYKDIFRNGFSHAATDLIFKEYPETFTVSYDHPFNDTIEFNLKKDPRFQLQFLQEIAQKRALEYFEYVITLISIIEDSLQRKYPGHLKIIQMEGGGRTRMIAKGFHRIPAITLGIYKKDLLLIQIVEKLSNVYNGVYKKVDNGGTWDYSFQFKTDKEFKSFDDATNLLVSANTQNPKEQ